jgi:hypothetical protein
MVQKITCNIKSLYYYSFPSFNLQIIHQILQAHKRLCSSLPMLTSISSPSIAPSVVAIIEGPCVVNGLGPLYTSDQGPGQIILLVTALGQEP